MPNQINSFSDLPDFPYEASDEVMELASRVKLALFDVDGVLTDGSLYYGSKEELFKRFNALDGHGLKMLEQAGIAVGVISARDSAALQTRMADLGITHCYLGVNNKLDIFKKIISELDIDPSECSFTGDDVIDLPVMQQCGLKLSVDNGHFIVKSVADWIAPISGGQGAARAICDLLLYSQIKYPLGATTQQ